MDTKRINELAKKSKTIGLTDEEKIEQANLRAQYIAEFRKSVTSQLDNVYLVDEKGNETKLKKKDVGMKN
ncbi:MAG: DUF896 domain-containing protein [Clostridia bacterium]